MHVAFRDDQDFEQATGQDAVLLGGQVVGVLDDESRPLGVHGQRGGGEFPAEPPEKQFGRESPAAPARVHDRLAQHVDPLEAARSPLAADHE